VFLGLNGLVVKSHGGTDAEGFASAIDIGYDVARHQLISRIEKAIGRSEQALPTLMDDRAAS
jgi:phosphate acyltransferase